MAMTVLCIRRGRRTFVSSIKALTLIFGILASVIVLLNISSAMYTEITSTTIQFENTGNFNYLDSSLTICNKNKQPLFLFIAVPSTTGNFRQRMAIRNSWGSVVKGDDSLQLVFFIGKIVNKENKDTIAKEKEKYMDIIEVDIEEKYENLAKKSISILQWIQLNCENPKYILKVDDDIFLNVNLLKTYLDVKNFSNSIVGCKVKGASPFRFPLSKWRISREEYKEDVFPDYISGPAYVISGDILSKLYLATKKVPYIFLEDVYLTGICRRHINAIAVGHPGFSCGYRDQGPCGGHFRYKITGHHYMPEEMERMWTELNDRWYTCPFKHSHWVSKLKDFIFYFV
nr:beta-1,3-galactosyltransferase 5 [Crassostrea gigas]XP_034298926.1 beta-1,3-galactosyltransferase 5 [Crassostrea gigas]